MLCANVQPGLHGCAAGSRTLPPPKTTANVGAGALPTAIQILMPELHTWKTSSASRRQRGESVRNPRETPLVTVISGRPGLQRIASRRCSCTAVSTVTLTRFLQKRPPIMVALQLSGSPAEPPPPVGRGQTTDARLAGHPRQQCNHTHCRCGAGRWHSRHSGKSRCKPCAQGVFCSTVLRLRIDSRRPRPAGGAESSSTNTDSPGAAGHGHTTVPRVCAVCQFRAWRQGGAGIQQAAIEPPGQRVLSPVQG